MSVEVATKLAEKTFSDKYFKWVALAGGGIVVVGAGIGGYLIYKKASELNPKNWFQGMFPNFGDIPSWLFTQQNGGLSPAGAMSPLLGLIDLLGLRDALNDETITAPEDLLRCDEGKPSIFKALLTATNPTLGLLWARACKKAKEEKEIKIEEQYRERYEQEVLDREDERQKLVASHYQQMADLRKSDEERWQQEQERLDAERQRLLEQYNQDQRALQDELKSTRAGDLEPTVPIVEEDTRPIKWVMAGSIVELNVEGDLTVGETARCELLWQFIGVDEKTRTVLIRVDTFERTDSGRPREVHSASFSYTPTTEIQSFELLREDGTLIDSLTVHANSRTGDGGRK